MLTHLPLSDGGCVAEGFLDVSAFLVTCQSVSLVIIVLPRSLPLSAELLDLFADVLAHLVETCN